MSVERIQSAIKYAISSEKATFLREQNIITFVVDKRTNKVELAQAASSLFGAEIVKVNIVNVKGKQKNRGNRKGRRSDVKKAYIKFVSLQTVDNVEGTVQ